MLEVAVALTIGANLYDQHCVAIRLRRTQLPSLDKLEVVLPPGTAFSASTGETCSLEIDGGEGATTVFSGVVSGIRQEYGQLRVTAHNGGLALARYRPAQALEQVTIGDVIQSLCSDAAVDVADIIEGPTLALYAVEGRAAAHHEIARLALLAGAKGAFDGEGQLHVTEDGGPGGELALRYGREIIEVTSEVLLPDESAFSVVGEGGGDASSPEARWVITDFTGGNGPDPGVSERLAVHPELRTVDDAQVAGEAYMQRNAVAASPIRLRLWAHPVPEPGMRLEFADMPETVSPGECRITQVVTTLVPAKGMTTDIWAGGSSDASGFGGALGGLL